MIVDSFDLTLSSPTNPGPTRFSDTIGESNTVIDLMFLRYGSEELDNYSILPDSCLSSDHAPLLIDIPISNKIIHMSKLLIIPKSEQETEFIKNVILNISTMDTSNIVDIKKLEQVVNLLRSIVDQAWSKNAKKLKITKYSKQWWSESCSRALNNYRAARNLENWKAFKKTVKDAKRTFFDDKIQEIANKSRGPWELMNWVKKRKLPATKAIKFNNCPCLTPESLWNTLHSSFNTALFHQVNFSILNEVAHKPTQEWNPLS